MDDKTMEVEMQEVVDAEIAEDMSVTRRYTSSLSNQLAQLGQMIVKGQDRLSDANSSLARAIEAAVQERTNAIEQAERVAMEKISLARQGHLADTIQINRELAGWSATRDALTLSYEALRAHGG